MPVVKSTFLHFFVKMIQKYNFCQFLIGNSKLFAPYQVAPYIKQYIMYALKCFFCFCFFFKIQLSFKNANIPIKSILSPNFCFYVMETFDSLQLHRIGQNVVQFRSRENPCIFRILTYVFGVFGSGSRRK